VWHSIQNIINAIHNSLILTAGSTPYSDSGSGQPILEVDDHDYCLSEHHKRKPLEHSYCQTEEEESNENQTEKQITSLDFMKLSAISDNSKPTDPMIQEIVRQITSNKVLSGNIQSVNIQSVIFYFLKLYDIVCAI
jgi:hypothetical protein